MVMSMTGFARVSQQSDSGGTIWEIRSVNHRYLEISWHLPEQLRDCEAKLRACLQQRFKRGKFDCTLKYQTSATTQPEVVINETLLDALVAAGQGLQQRYPDLQPLRLSDLLTWPGMLAIKPAEDTALKTQLEASFATALEQLATARLTEGEALAMHVCRRVSDAQGLLGHIQPFAACALKQQREKILARLTDLDVTAEPQRLAQELVYWAQKADVAEELDRLAAHFIEISAVLAQHGAVGRRLDFLMQECHREANTLAVKAAGTASTPYIVDLKVLIEQMREQVQNIE
jgi:uncharacterized protein (TIGR00255 family)